MQSEFVEVDGARVSYVRSVQGGHPVIFVHGGFGSSSQLWHLTMDRLPAGFSGIAVNNFLESDPPPGGYSVQSFAERLGHFALALDLEKPVIVGHSMGGVVCQLAALAFPDLWSGVVLVGTGPTTRNHGVAASLLQRLETEGITEAGMREISANWFHRAPPEGFFDDYVARALTVPVQAMIDVQRSMMAVDLVDRLGGITAPALVVHGEQDVGRPIAHARMLAEGIPAGRLCLIEGCGHSPMLERPERFDACFHSFLTQVTGGQEHRQDFQQNERIE